MSTTPVPASASPSHPGSASKKAPGHITTPSHLGLSSPAPRSVPSPAATRKDQATKTPITHPATASSQGSKTLGGTPMVHSLSQAGNSAQSTSPLAQGMSFTPTGLGVDMTPGQLNMATPGMGGVPMNVTLSELGIGQPKRNEDEERRAKMRKVLQRIGKPKGRLSVEGMTRVAKRSGCLQVNPLDASAGISIAYPNKVMVDVELQDDVPKNVEVVFDTQNKGLESQTAAIGDVLLQDLRAAASPVETQLDRFATNLGRLARVDLLSHDGINCFEALSGVYVSLHKLYRKELQRAKPYHVMKKESGRPTVHQRRRIGLDLQYWSSSTSGDDHDAKPKQNDLHMLHLDVERHPAAEYPAIRISETWLPDPLELPSAETGEGIPWQDPPPTLKPVSTDGNAMAVDSAEKSPNVRFIATLDPPVVLPWQVANAVLQSVGVQHQFTEIPTAWHTAVIDSAPEVACNDAISMSPISSEAQVIARTGDGGETQITHSYKLEPLKAVDASFKLTKIPFSHPRQLVEALPTLRQWAYLGMLLKQTMQIQQDKDMPAKGNGAGAANAPNPPADYSLADLLTPAEKPITQSAVDRMSVNIGFITSPVPTLSISFPTEDATTVRGVSVQVLSNAELTVIVHDGESIAEAKDEEKKAAESKDLGRALEACGDLGVWLEWLKRR